MPDLTTIVFWWFLVMSTTSGQAEYVHGPYASKAACGNARYLLLTFDYVKSECFPK